MFTKTDWQKHYYPTDISKQGVFLLVVVLLGSRLQTWQKMIKILIPNIFITLSFYLSFSNSTVGEPVSFFTGTRLPLKKAWLPAPAPNSSKKALLPYSREPFLGVFTGSGSGSLEIGLTAPPAPAPVQFTALPNAIHIYYSI